MKTRDSKADDGIPDGPKFLSVREAACRCGIGKTLTYEWLAKGMLRSVKIGGRRLIDLESIRDIQTRCRAGLDGSER